MDGWIRRKQRIRRRMEGWSREGGMDKEKDKEKDKKKEKVRTREGEKDKEKG